MTFDAPVWLILLPFLALLGWRWRGLRLHEPLRAFALGLVVLALTAPRTRWGDEGRDVWVLVDRSDSAAGALDAALPEWEQLLARGRGHGDRLRYVDFADTPVRRDRGDPVFRGRTDATHLAAAVRYTLSEVDPRRPSRLVVLSDGQSTEPLDGVAEALVRAGTPLDYRLSLPPAATDYQLTDLRLPMEVETGAAFLLEARVRGTVDASIPWELLRDGQVVGRGELRIRNGTAHLRLTDRLTGSGVVNYELRLLPQEDAHPENNRASAWVLAGGRGHVMLLTAFADDPLIEILRAGGVTVDVVTDASALPAGRLAGVRAVIFHNLPAWKVSREFLGELNFFVREQGGGLLMVGGRASFASGGYFQSPIDDLLPVSMELRQDQRKLAVALAIVMDRSGSMAVAAGPGQTKMDLADAGAARAIDLLGDVDLISVHAVDSEAHEVVPLTKVGPSRRTLRAVVRRIASTGGGIYVHQGLEAGWKELQKATVGQRHLILFSDAADSEEPGDYLTLLDQMRQEKVTVSVIGLGTEKDSDADLLKDIAARGGGRMFFSDDAGALPGIFAQETVTIARAAFIDEPIGLQATAGWREIAAQPLSWPNRIDGYNLSYLRPGATQAAISTDEYQAPLVASWQRGAGRVAAVTFPLGGDYSALSRAWPQYSDFARTLVRWLMSDDVPAGLGLRTMVHGDRLDLALFVDAERAATAVQQPPSLVVATREKAGTGSPGETRSVPWERIAPGEFEASVPLPASTWLRGAVQVGEYTLPFGPVSATAQAEWLSEPERIEALRLVAQQSGGGERLDLADVWTAPLPAGGSSAVPWLLVAALAVTLADALLTRLGVRIWRRG